jgi:hypothetical protein
MPSVLVQEVLSRLDDGWSLDQVEWFIDDLRLDDERAAALWLLAWVDPEPSRISVAQPGS